MKLNLILLAFAIVCAFAAVINKQEAKSAKETVGRLYQNQNILLTRLRKVQNETTLIKQQNIALSKEAHKDHAYFDWFADISTTAVVKRLQKR